MAVLANSYANPGPALTLNRAAFTYSSSNYRHPHIADLLARVDVDAQGCMLGPRVRAELDRTALDFRDAESLLKDLVDRRNQAAHSYQPRELLDVTVLGAYLSVVCAYLYELIATAQSQLLMRLTERAFLRIGIVARRWSGRLGVEMDSGQAQAPFALLIKKNDRVFCTRVTSLESDGKAIERRVEYLGSVIQLGLGVERTTPAWSKGSEAFVVPAEWEHLTGL